MANSTKTHDLMNGPTADALQVDANFDEIHEFLNSQVLHTDGSRPMSNPLQLEDGSPAASQSYVDAATTGIATTAGFQAVGTLTIPFDGSTQSGSMLDSSISGLFNGTPRVFLQSRRSDVVASPFYLHGSFSGVNLKGTGDGSGFGAASSNVTVDWLAIGSAA